MTLHPGDRKLSFDTPFVPIGAISKEEFENNHILAFVFYLYRFAVILSKNHAKIEVIQRVLTQVNLFSSK